MATKKVRVLVPNQVPHTAAASGDVIEMESAEADVYIAGGAVEAASSASLSTAPVGNTPPAEPMPVRSGPYDPPEGAKERLDVGEGGNTPPAEPLPVGSGPYEPPASATEQLDVGEGGRTPDFVPLPVAPESETVRPTDEKGQPNYDVTEETENITPTLSYADWKMADLRAAVKDRNLTVKSTKKAALVKALEEDDGLS